MHVFVSFLIMNNQCVVMKHLKSTEITLGDSGSTVVKVLCYKSEGRWFEPSWCHRNFSLK